MPGIGLAGAGWSPLEIFAAIFLPALVAVGTWLAVANGRLRDRLREAEEANRALAARNQAQSETERQLRASEARFRQVVDSNMIGIVFWKTSGEIVEANDYFLDSLGYSRDDLKAGRVNWIAMTPPEHHRSDGEKLAESAAHGAAVPYEKDNLRKDGSRMTVIVGGARLPGVADAGVGFMLDITVRKQAEAALRESEERNRRLVELSPAAIFVHCDGILVYVNQAAVRLFGADVAGDLVGKPVLDIVHPDERVLVRERIQRILQDQVATTPREIRMIRLDGKVVDVEACGSPFSYQQRSSVYVVANDITERRRAATALQSSEERFRQLAEHINEVFWIIGSPHGEVLYVSPSFERVFGCAAEVVYRNPISWLDVIHPEDRQRIIAATPKMAVGTYNEEYRVVRADGSVRWLRSRAFPVRGRDGQVYRIAGVSEDITDRQLSDAALRESEARYRILADNSGVGIWHVSPEGLTVYINPVMCRMLGIRGAGDIGEATFHRFFTPESLELMSVEHAKRRHGVASTYEVVLVSKDAERRRVVIFGAPLQGKDGAFGGFIGTFIDVTERRQLEEQLRQAQKMEAIGQLAGGVAHDFNNLLTVITGYGEMHLGTLAGDDSRRRNVEQILRAAKRAGSLTQQLLAFSRRQMLQPKVIDANLVAADMGRLLRRLISEDIELVVAPGPGLSLILADPGQIEQILMNLAVNARDAMPKGGQLAIRIANVEVDASLAQRHLGLKPGNYVQLTVSDTGVGMEAQTLGHIFEPFFTTKEQGKGTGLGLPTVYGIVKQSGGVVVVASEPGKGTTFDIFLPRVQGEVSTLSPPLGSPTVGGGTETILLVEDEQDVREYVQETLVAEGYRVLAAENGKRALEVSAQHQQTLHLVLTDVIMPLMSGHEMVEHLLRTRPATRVLYMSGYTDKAIVHHGVLDPSIQFLEKPFTREVLLRKVREAIGSL